MNRKARIERNTKETQIELTLNIDGNGSANVTTGIGFFDHMLSSLAFHAGFDLDIMASGDLYVDSHHTIEDVGIVLGKAFSEALGDKSGISRFGFFAMPMDESLSLVSVDVSGRPYLVFDGPIPDARIGDFDTNMVEEFMRAFCFNAGITLHIKLMYGKNSHHIVESMFKGLAKALAMALSANDEGKILSAKGIL